MCPSGEDKKAGSDLLSHSLNCSTIGARDLNYRVRDGIGCDFSAMATGQKLGKKGAKHPFDDRLRSSLGAKLQLLSIKLNLLKN